MVQQQPGRRVCGVGYRRGSLLAACWLEPSLIGRTAYHGSQSVDEGGDAATAAPCVKRVEDLGLATPCIRPCDCLAASSLLPHHPLAPSARGCAAGHAGRRRGGDAQQAHGLAEDGRLHWRRPGSRHRRAGAAGAVGPQRPPQALCAQDQGCVGRPPASVTCLINLPARPHLPECLPQPPAAEIDLGYKWCATCC
jgi:hypothetical protein